MTVFDIRVETGYSRILKGDNIPDTPWLLHSQDGLNFKNIKLTQIILSERGYLKLNTPGFGMANKSDVVLDKIPNWSILTPRLYPAAKNLNKSLTYELNLYLDRLDQTVFPKAFGLVYDPFNSDREYLESLLSYEPSIIVLRYPNIEDTSPRKSINYLLDTRKVIPPDIAIYLPGSGGIGFQSLLIALGVDILDDSASYRFAARQKSFWDNYIHYDPDSKRSELIQTNKDFTVADFEGVIYNLKRNTIWTRLARDMHVHPHIASAIHLLSNDYRDQLELSKFPKFEDNHLQFTGEEMLYHPDVMAYRKRLVNRFQEKQRTKIILLLPCSAKKPYHESYSHKIYYNAIKQALGWKKRYLSVWSLTSPLGVVPYELETVYPAKNYDIPVTGNWTEEETQVTGELLGTLLSKLEDDVIILAHVSEGYKDMIEIAGQYREINISWASHKSRSKKALDALKKSLEKISNQMEFEKATIKASFVEGRDTINAIARFNHGIDVNLNFDPESVRILGRPPRPLQVQKNKQHWITWDKLNGEIRLSKRAITELAQESHNWIMLNTDNLRGSTLFGVGVHLASDKISPGDEVLFFNKDKSLLLGVGVATVSGISMNMVNSGRVANIRYKVEKQVAEL